MASRQRSFFDQKHSGSKPKGQWRSNRTYPLREQYRPEYIPPPPKPPIRASTHSRSKLQAFTFTEPHDSVMLRQDAAGHGSDKENEDVAGCESQKSQRAKPKTSHEMTRVSPPSEPHSKPASTPKPLPKQTIPPTPGITLDDLLDEGREREPTPPQSTPRDQVGWAPTNIRSSQLHPLTPTARKGTKRRRSESPTSSRGSGKGRAQVPNRALQSFETRTPLRTPRYEPGPELWNRYARNELTTPSRPPATARPDMMHSSPQEPFASGSRSWKRATSDLTHTARKRRRLEARQNAISSQEPFSDRTEVTSTNPRITRLLERLKEATEENTEANSRQVSQDMHPSSSSPLPAGVVVSNVTLSASQQLAELVVSDDAGDEQIADEDLLAVDVRDPNVGEDRVHAYENHDISREDLMALDALPSDPMTGQHESENLTAPVPELSKRSSMEFDLADDELLSTCIAAERASTVRPDLRQLAPVIDRRDAHFDTGIDISAQEAGEQAHATATVTMGDYDEEEDTCAAAQADNEFADDFDADDIAGIDLAMSHYPEQGNETSPTEEKTEMNYDRMENDMTHAQPAEAAVYGEQENPVDLIDDEFGDDDVEDLFAELVTEQETIGVLPSKEQSQLKAKTIQRYLVETVQEGQYMTDKGFKRQEKVVLVKEEKSGMSKVILLRDTWFDSPCTPGSFVHVLAKVDLAGQYVVNSTEGIIVLHPDYLISATVVADSFGCMRRAVLQDRVKATNEANEPLVYGSILHEVFQDALKSNRWDTVWIDELIAKACERHLESLYEINVEVEQAMGRLRDKASQLQSWAMLFVKHEPNSESIVKDRNGSTALMSINKLLDVEEHIWSPMYGLKGNVDATVQVLMQDGEGTRTLTVPLELKTGRNSSNQSHKAQTALYTLLMSDRYDIEVRYGILYYLESSEVSRIPGLRHELIHMIKQRNELACYVRSRLELPPMLKNERLCSRCYAQPSCFAYHKLVEDGDGETSGLKDVFMEKTRHLLPQHQEFFRKWDTLLTKEEGDLMKFKRELWTMTSAERQKVGRCFSKVVIEPGSIGEIPGAEKINRFKYTFAKKEPSPYFSFTESQITQGEPIVISDEQGHYALANGYVTSLRKNTVTVAVDRRLHNARIRSEDFHGHTNQSFAGIMDVSKSGTSDSQRTKESAEPVIYRIDKDEFSNGMATVRNNLIRLMEKDTFRSHPLRRLIIDLVAPVTLTNFIQSKIPASQDQLNVDQKAAIEKVMTAKDYALILGMPGTGKTTTIAHIIRSLTSQGKSVLLTSYTHTAVDNILLKIKKDKINVLRIGALAKVHPEVAEFANLTSDPKASFDDLRSSYNSQVVATTCLGINHSVFNQRIFDYCIVDEASQITLPVCLGPIRMAKAFILVGDHYQLPPLVQNKEAQEGGLDVSLFKYLSDAHPNSVVTLEHQYRMCEEIMSLSNALIYSGRLKCGNRAVATRRLEMPKFADLSSHHHTSNTLPISQITFCPAPKPGLCWLHDALHPSYPVIFLNTDGLGDIAQEQAQGSRVVNQVEVTLTAQLVRAFLTTGLPAAEIGVVTLYRSQLALMRQELKARSSAASGIQGSASAAADVEMHTADKYQGRDKEAIVLSLVRSNEANNVGDLLKDWRRVNVAITRARSKMIILGSWKTISSGNELLGRFCHLVEQNGWRHDLKKGAVTDHCFEDWITQATGQQGNEPPSPVRTAKISLASKTRTRLYQTTLDKENVQPIQRNNPPYKRPTMRQPGKTATAGAATIMNKRPVLRNIAMDLDEAAFGEFLG